MANSTTPFGFMPYGRVDGGAPTYELERVYINSSDANLYFTGDLVSRSSAGGNYITITWTSTSQQLPAGVFWGCKFFSGTVGYTRWSRYYPGSVGSNALNGACEAYIISDPNVLFRAVGGSSTTLATWAAADVGLNTVHVTSQSSLGNTVTGQSAQIASTTTTTNSSAPWKIFDLLANRTVSGAPGTDAAAGNQVILKPNAWERGAGTTGAST